MARYEVSHRYGIEYLELPEADIQKVVAYLKEVDWYVQGEPRNTAIHSDYGKNIISITRIDNVKSEIGRSSRVKKSLEDNELKL